MPGFVRRAPAASGRRRWPARAAVRAARRDRLALVARSRPPVPLAIEGVVVDERSLPARGDDARVRTLPHLRRPHRNRRSPQPATPEPAPAAMPRSGHASRRRGASRARAHANARRASERRSRRASRRRPSAPGSEKRRCRGSGSAQGRQQAEAERRKAAEDASAPQGSRAKQQATRSRVASADWPRRKKRRPRWPRSGVVDEYRAELEQAIERNWIRPPSAQAGLDCTLHVTQAPGGTVLDVKLGDCNGDEAVRESITNAVFRASPLPAPRRSTRVRAATRNRIQTDGVRLVSTSIERAVRPGVTDPRPVACCSASQHRRARRSCGSTSRRASSDAVPIAVVPFGGQPEDGPGDVAAVVGSDLQRSGRFEPMARADMVTRPVRGEQIRFEDWRVLKSDFLVVGRGRARRRAAWSCASSSSTSRPVSNCSRNSCRRRRAGCAQRRIGSPTSSSSA